MVRLVIQCALGYALWAVGFWWAILILIIVGELTRAEE